MYQKPTLESSYQILKKELGQHFWHITSISEDIKRTKKVGYCLRVSSPFRKEMVLPIIKDFIAEKQLPLKVTEKYPFTSQFEIYFIK